MFSKTIIETLNKIKSSGSVWATGVKEFVHPGLEINNIGKVGFPLKKIQINELIKAAKKAPFGKGSETIVDTTVRSAWGIDAADIRFASSKWQKFISKLTDEIKITLGLENKHIEAILYKLLIYETDDFFLRHRDSEKNRVCLARL